MKDTHTQIDKHGRLLIPAPVRKLLNYKSGDIFVLNVANDELHVSPFNKVIKKAQALFRQHNNSPSAVNEFLEQKYTEAAKENNSERKQ